MTVKDSTIYKKIRKTYYDVKKWDETKDNRAISKILKPYHNLHRGQRCFVIGNGPSLKAEDLTRIWNLDIPTFACNRIHMIFSQTEWRPTYYFISDAKIVELEAKIVELQNQYAKAYADTQNMQKRLQNEFELSKKYRIQSFALDILPVIDNCERALAQPTTDEKYKKGKNRQITGTR